MPQQMLCAWLNGSPMLSAYCSKNYCVTLVGHVADGRPTTERVIWWLTKYPYKLMIWFGSIDILWFMMKMKTRNYYKTTKLGLNDNMIYQMKKHISNWIYSNQKVVITCLTDTSVFILSRVADTMLCIFFFNGFVFRINPQGT